MSRISDKFAELKNRGERALIPFITAGDPDLKTTSSLVLELERRGADIIELGIPFSDPLADGPVIQRSSQRALKGKVSVKDVLNLVGELRGTSEIPLVLMTYYNPVLKYGIKNFVKEAKIAGVDGLIVSDLPPEESRLLKSYTQRQNLDLIFLLAPTSSKRRIKLVVEQAGGFIYCVSRTGVTGVREEIFSGLKEFIRRVKAQTNTPLGVGFGISTPSQAREVAEIAEAIIVGSALVKIIDENLNNSIVGRPSGPKLVKEVGDFVEELKRALA